jgi:hypothetical protein
MTVSEARDVRVLWRKARTITAWGALVAFASLLAADVAANSANPNGWYMPVPENLNLSTNRMFEFAVAWRKLSLLALVLLIVVSLPRWQSLLAMALTVVYIAYTFVMFD